MMRDRYVKFNSVGAARKQKTGFCPNWRPSARNAREHNDQQFQRVPQPVCVQQDSDSPMIRMGLRLESSSRSTIPLPGIHCV
jgi:hypothetical protein